MTESFSNCDVRHDAFVHSEVAEVEVEVAPDQTHAKAPY